MFITVSLKDRLLEFALNCLEKKIVSFKKETQLTVEGIHCRRQ